MKQVHMLWPLAVHGLLLVSLYLRLALVKKREVDAKNVDLKATAADQEQWPLSVRLVNNNIRNQSETPILFIITSFILVATNKGTSTTLILASVYMALRIAHAIVHTTSNKVMLRFPLFVAGLLVLLVLFGFAVSGLYQVS